MTLQLLICTIDRGIDRVCDLVLPPLNDISYVVSWQHSTADDDRTVPSVLQRDDIQVHHLDGRGLSRNRNHCLRHATGDICMVCDDDCRYHPQWLRAVVNAFEQQPTLDVATFMMQSEYCHKHYPKQSIDLRHSPAGYYPTSFELAFRRSSVQDRLQFNEHFGLGAQLFHCGEEEIFVHDALSLGLSCRFLPITVVEHDHPTTDQTRSDTVGVLMGRGAYLYIGYRSKMFFYPLPIAWRLHRRHGSNLWHCLKYMYKGLFHILRHRELASAGIIKKR